MTVEEHIEKINEVLDQFNTLVGDARLEHPDHFSFPFTHATLTPISSYRGVALNFWGWTGTGAGKFAQTGTEIGF